MTLTQIKYFLEVCETRNFTRAAANLYVAQSSLSRQIRLLEEEIGIQLLVRDNRNVVLTQAGIVFKNEFEKIVKDINTALHKVCETGMLKKEIHIGLWAGLGPEAIKNFMNHFNGYFDDYKIYIHKDNSKQLKKMFELGETDVVINIEGAVCKEQSTCTCIIEQLPACIIYSDRLFPDGKKPEKFTDFNGKKMVCVHDEIAQNVRKHQIDIMKTIGIVPSQYTEAENALFTLLYTEPTESFSIWYNEIPKNLNIYSIPEDVAAFNVCAHWSNDTPLPLLDFFLTYYAM